MKKEIIDWYTENHYSIDKVVKIGYQRFGLSEAKILTAMEHCYLKKTNGKDVKMIDMARYIFNVAKDIDGLEYKKKLADIKDQKDIFKKEKRKYLRAIFNQTKLLKKFSKKITDLNAEILFLKKCHIISYVFIFVLDLLVFLFVLNLE